MALRSTRVLPHKSDITIEGCWVRCFERLAALPFTPAVFLLRKRPSFLDHPATAASPRAFHDVPCRAAQTQRVTCSPSVTVEPHIDLAVAMAFLCRERWTCWRSHQSAGNVQLATTRAFSRSRTWTRTHRDVCEGPRLSRAVDPRSSAPGVVYVAQAIGAIIGHRVVIDCHCPFLVVFCKVSVTSVTCKPARAPSEYDAPARMELTISATPRSLSSRTPKQYRGLNGGVRTNGRRAPP